MCHDSWHDIYMIFAVQFAIQSPVPPDSPMTESPGMFKPAQPPQAQYWVRTFPFMAFFFKAKLVDFLLRSVYKHLLKIVYCLVLILNEYYLEILLLAKFNEIMVKFIIRCVSNLCVYLLMCTKYIMCDQYFRINCRSNRFSNFCNKITLSSKFQTAWSNSKTICRKW